MLEIITRKRKESCQREETNHVLHTWVDHYERVITAPLVEQVDHDEGLDYVKEASSDDGGEEDSITIINQWFIDYGG